jgi:hypothetical protein
VGRARLEIRLLKGKLCSIIEKTAYKKSITVISRN